MSLKSVDQLIEKYGVSAFSTDTPFIRRRLLTNEHAYEVGMPFCFHQKLNALKQGISLWCFTAYLPHKKQRLAMYLVNERNGEIVEQVYYPRDSKGVKACEKVKNLLSSSLMVANADSFILVA